jgi:hypothetical protein
VSRLGGAVAALALTALFASDARAAPELQTATHDYFAGEKSSGYLWGSIGILAVASGSFLLTRKTPVTTGAAYPLIGIGAIQTILGGVLLLTTDARVTKQDEKLLADGPGAYREAELTRIRGVNRTFVILEIVEAVLIVGGTTLAIAGRDTWRGVGIGLAIQGTTMLALDGLAHARSGRYERTLESINVSATPQTLTISGSF